MLAYDLFSHIIAAFREVSVNCMVSASCLRKRTVSCLHAYAPYIFVMVTVVHGPMILRF